jgi:hypothetical protein
MNVSLVIFLGCFLPTLQSLFCFPGSGFGGALSDNLRLDLVASELFTFRSNFILAAGFKTDFGLPVFSDFFRQRVCS